MLARIVGSSGTVLATAGREVRLKDAGIDAQRVKSRQRCLCRCVGIARITKELPGWFEMGSSLPLECHRDQRSLPVGSGASAARRIPSLFMFEKGGKEKDRGEALIGESWGTYGVLEMACGGRCGCQVLWVWS